MNRIGETFSSYIKSGAFNSSTSRNDSRSVSKVIERVSSIFKRSTFSFSTQNRSETFNHEGTAKTPTFEASTIDSKCDAIFKTANAIIQMDMEIKSLKESHGSKDELELIKLKRDQACNKLSELVGQITPKDLANAFSSLSNENHRAVVQVLKKSGADLTSVLIYLLENKRFTEYKQLGSEAFGENTPKEVCDAEIKMLRKLSRKKDVNCISKLWPPFTFGTDKIKPGLNKEEIVAFDSGVLRWDIYSKINDQENHFQAGEKFSKIQSLNNPFLQVYCDISKELIISGDKIGYERLEKSIRESGAPSEIQEKFLSAAKEIPQEQAVAALKANLDSGNIAISKALITHNTHAAEQLYMQYCDQGEIEKCAQLLIIAGDSGQNILGLMKFIGNTNEKTKNTSELSVARYKNMTESLSNVDRKKLIDTPKLSSKDLLRVLDDLTLDEMRRLSLREGSASVVQSVFNHSPQALEKKLFLFMKNRPLTEGKNLLQEYIHLLKEVAIAGDERLCNLIIKTYVPLQDKEILAQARADLLGARIGERAEKNEKGARILGKILREHFPVTQLPKQFSMMPQEKLLKPAH